RGGSLPRRELEGGGCGPDRGTRIAQRRWSRLLLPGHGPRPPGGQDAGGRMVRQGRAVDAREPGAVEEESPATGGVAPLPRRGRGAARPRGKRPPGERRLSKS